MAEKFKKFKNNDELQEHINQFGMDSIILSDKEILYNDYIKGRDEYRYAHEFKDKITDAYSYINYECAGDIDSIDDFYDFIDRLKS